MVERQVWVKWYTVLYKLMRKLKTRNYVVMKISNRLAQINDKHTKHEHWYLKQVSSMMGKMKMVLDNVKLRNKSSKILKCKPKRKSFSL